MSQGNIQVLLYRDFEIDGQKKLKQTLVANVSDSVNLFSKLPVILDLIEEDERYNVHYSLAYCADMDKSKGIPLRTFLAQDIVPIDLDGIELERKDEYIKLVIETLHLDRAKTGIFCSGNGLHFIIRLDRRIESIDTFKALKANYDSMCGEINFRMFDEGLLGHADTQRWAVSATLRLPNTLNRKEGKPDAQAYTIQGNVEPQPFELTDYGTEQDEHARYRKVDSSAVLTGCEFLKWCLTNQKEVKEPQWYAMIGILAYIPEIGKQLCHDYSKEHPNYDHDTTEAKFNQARDLGKPRVCESVSKVFDCRTCTNFGRCKTPLQIKSNDFIATEDTGYHTPKIKDGVIVGYTPCYDDLYKFFSKTYSYVYDPKIKALYVWNGKHWEERPIAMCNKFATEHFQPTANNTMRKEFEGLVVSRNHVDSDYFLNKSQGHVNFGNGILRLKDRKLIPHSKTFGFLYVLPYDYDPEARCPEFNAMMDRLTSNDASVKQLLLEYMGYCISGIPSAWGQRALILVGEGGTGKSTFLDILRAMVGKTAFSSVPLTDFNNPAMRGAMYGKLFNVNEETSYNALRDSSEFKNIVTGGTVVIKYLWREPFTAVLNTKLILACNELPPTNDKTNATYRRLLIVPFRNKFVADESKLDKDLVTYVQENEMPGVYNMVLDAYDILMKTKLFSKSVTVDKEIEEYIEDNDIIKRFIFEHVVIAEDTDSIMFSELFANFREWCRDNNLKDVISSISFGKKLSPHLGKTSLSKQQGGVVRLYKGYRLINPRLGGAKY